MKFTKREMPKGDGNGKAYLKLVNDGDSMTGIFRGEVFEFFQIWPFGGEKQIFDTRVPGSVSRFKVNFVVHEGGKFVAKIWEFGLQTYNQLAEYAENYDLEQTKIKLTRRGSGKATIWMTMPLLKETLTKKQLAEIEAVELNVLNGAQAQAAAPAEEPADDSEIPF